jgi:hypothetical protein
MPYALERWHEYGDGLLDQHPHCLAARSFRALPRAHVFDGPVRQTAAPAPSPGTPAAAAAVAIVEAWAGLGAEQLG